MRQANFSFLTLIAAVFLLSACGNSNTAIHSSMPPSINVAGTGEVKLAPDMATLTLSVVREAETAEAALDASSGAMNEVIAAMKEQGLRQKDLRTSNFDIQPKYVYPKNDNRAKKPRIVGYTVRNALTVTVRDLDKLGEVIRESVALGVNQGGNIEFGNSDPAKAMNEARALAMKDAKSRAETLARAADVELCELLRVNEQSTQPYPVARRAMAADTAMESVPVAAGENSYRVTVSASYGIEQ